MLNRIVLSLIFALALAIGGSAQTTAFTFQGSLQNGGTPANGNYDFEFKLFDLLSAGTQQGSTIQRLNVAVANGVFAVSLDFAAGTLPGADRYLDIAVRTAGGGAFTALTPRQRVNSSPYSIKSLNSTTADTAANATQLGGVAANQYVLTGDSRLSDARNPLPGSTNYIQNQNAGTQAASNFNISGNGTAGGTFSANIINTDGYFSFAGSPVFRISGAGMPEQLNSNTMAGVEAGQSTTPSTYRNTFIGRAAGRANTLGKYNTFIGSHAGTRISNEDYNTFVGTGAGEIMVGGRENAFFGDFTGSLGMSILTGNKLTLIGSSASAASGLTNATAIGAYARVDASDSLVLGNNVNVGIGDTAPTSRLVVRSVSSTAIYSRSESNHALDAVSINGRGVNAFGGAYGGFFDTTGNGIGINVHSVSGTAIYARSENTHALHADGSILVNRWIVLNELRGGGGSAVCRNASNELSFCSSSIRYKKNIGSFRNGLSLVKQLEPITFDWRADGNHDLGLAAEEVERVDPLLVTYNDKGEVEGVKYDQLSVVLINAVKEQQAQIDAQAKEIVEQRDINLRLQKQVDLLTKSICRTNPSDEVCKEEK